MSSIRQTDIVERLIDHWKDLVSSDLREEAAKEINDLRRACRAMARDIMRLKDSAQSSQPSQPGKSAAA
jgi:hypothetical protein